MNEVSIIINGVRYDAVEGDKERVCCNCDLDGDCKLSRCCGDFIGLDRIFKISNKKVEK